MIRLDPRTRLWKVSNDTSLLEKALFAPIWHRFPLARGIILLLEIC